MESDNKTFVSKILFKMRNFMFKSRNDKCYYKSHVMMNDIVLLPLWR